MWSSASSTPSGAASEEVASMMDIVYVLITLIFFLLSWLYVRACERV